MLQEARKDRNFAATLLLETLGIAPQNERELAHKTAGARLITDACAELTLLRKAWTQ